ncbi:MAG: non-canonical purine NTP diphosphatase [Bacteroidaceae bacterium]|nr:non-canonical purine NTP diphosphatase [Bacteroidaceae bacterium]
MKLVFATNNAHKLQEVRQILGSRFEVVGLADIGCTEDIPETAETLEGNALQKAFYVKEHYGLDCFADDTGLEVTALGGAPGVHTARYAELFANSEEGDASEGFTPSLSHDSNANMNLLLHNLEKKADRSARFRTVIALLYKGKEHLFEGICEGTILTERHGTEGFGYDPVFQPKGYDQCFAQMTADEKNAISHRGRATQKLIAFLNDN